MKRSSLSSLSISQRLPLLICTLLLSVILVFGIISYLGVRNAALKVGHERLQNLSTQLSEMLGASVNAMFAANRTTANAPAVKAFLLSGGKDSAQRLKALLDLSQKDSTYMGGEIRDAQRKLLLSTAPARLARQYSVDSLLTGGPLTSKDTFRLGKFIASGDTAFYPLLVAATDGQQVLGYLVFWRRIASSSRSKDQISQLTGDNVNLYLGNQDGSLWTNLMKPVPYRSFHNQINVLDEYVDSNNNSILSFTSPIRKSPWLVSVEVEKLQYLETANYFLYWLLLSGVVILVVGAVWAWYMSRNISQPLIKLTAAASRIAAGNYSEPVPAERLDELGKLARSFNAMSATLKSSHKMLEDKAENYRMLFERNPLPMWIFSKATYTIINVNDAAIFHYGYSKEEFLQLSSLDLRPQEDVGKFLEFLATGQEKNKRVLWRHKKKDGSIIMVEVIADDITHQEQEAKLVLCNDITEKLKAEAELVRHRVMQQELITETTIQAQEKEREELGKELHDNINQILTSTKLYLELAENDPELHAFAISKSSANVNMAISAIRQLSKQLVPPSLDNSLSDSLRDLTQEIEAITPLSFSFITESFKEELLNENVKLMIYRVVQEQLNNILKYAAASRVEVLLETDTENVFLKIIDDGVGFDMNNKGKGIGLRNIDNRVKFNKGKYNITSSPGKGCRLEIEVPLQSTVFEAY